MTDKKKIHIHMVEDDADTLEDILGRLKKEFGDKCEYEAFTEVSLFIKRLPEADIALVDHLLRDATGYDIIDIIWEENRNRRSVNKIKVIIMSGTRDIDVVAYYMNQKRARFFVNKNKRVDGEYVYLNEIVTYTREAIKELQQDISFERVLVEQENSLNFIASETGTDSTAP